MSLQKRRNFSKNSSRPEVGTCAAIIATQAWGATILLVIALAQQLFLSGCADACAASILAILSAIAQAQVKYDYK